MNKQAWIAVGIIAAIAVGVAWFVGKKTTPTDSATNTQSQLPSQEAEANYNVPPSIAVSPNAPTNVYQKTAYDGTQTFTTSQGNSLPMNQ